MRIPAFLLPLFLALALNAAPEASTAPSSTEPPKETSAFAQGEIPEAANKTAQLLSEIRQRIGTPEERKKLDASLPGLIASTRTLRKKLAVAEGSRQSVKELRTRLEILTVRLRKLRDRAESLNGRLEDYGELIERLDTLERQWRNTLEKAKETKAPEAILQRARETLARIRNLRKELKTLYDTTLTSLDAVTGEMQAVESLADGLQASLASRSTDLLTLDSPSLPSALMHEGVRPGRYLRDMAAAAGSMLRQALLFYRANLSALYAHLAATLLFALLMVYLFWRQKRGTLFLYDDEKIRIAKLFVRRPFAATLLMAVLAVPLFYPEQPVSVGEINTLIALATLLWMLRGDVAASTLRFTALLGLFYLVGALQSHMHRSDAALRLVWFAMEAAMLWASLRFLRTGDAFARRENDRAIRFLARLSPLIPLVAFVSLFANLVGAVNLSVQLFTALVASLVLFVIFVTVARIAGGLIVMFVRRRAVEYGHPLDTYAAQIQSYLTFVVNLFLMAYWFYLVLRQFDVLYYVQKWWHSLMKLSWQVGEVSVSVGAVVDFLIVLAVTAFATRLVSVLLDLEIFSRYRFPRGVPAAIQMIVRYLIITVGVVFALTVLGVRLTDLSLIAGALGVGIGFGLRNIMANFVSGLLLVFERPVQQGDVVQVGGVMGDVQKIGVRATTIKTYDGSEVIVPNADFITKEVTNWTLSSKSRRIKMAYKVAFGNDPREVIEIIRQAIESHPDIRKDPRPKVLFEGYGDYYLEFTVYFWVDERLLDIKSEAALLIYEALTEAGIEMPVPLNRVTLENNG